MNEKNMNRTRFFYLRKDGTRQSEIVGCCAYRTVEHHVEYAVSALNSRFDRFDRHEAREIAEERLNRTSVDVKPVVPETTWNRLKMKVGLLHQSYRAVAPKFTARQILADVQQPYRAILEDLSRAQPDACPTSLKKAAKRMLRSPRGAEKLLSIQEPQQNAVAGN